MGFHERRPLSLAASFLAKDISPSFQRLMRHRMEWIRFNRHPCPLFILSLSHSLGSFELLMRCLRCDRMDLLALDQFL